MGVFDKLEKSKGGVKVPRSNIVIFSSGLSEKNGITESVKKHLNEKGYNCVDWRGLFANANDTENIALLPMLIKEIPTFDFAVLICEGHDITYISRGENSETAKTMRDNVLFEIGLCAMAIGLNRTILLTDSDVRLPDDLRGTNGRLAVKQIAFSKNASSINNQVLEENIESVCEEIDAYICCEKENLMQIVIGAAASSACGYASNFICRTLEHIDDEIIIKNGEKTEKIFVSSDQVYLHIVLPNNLDKIVLNEIKGKQSDMLRGSIVTARNRPADFSCWFEGDDLHIIDYPTSVVTSYDTARMILEMDADDSYDETATERFVAKEMALYKSTLKTLMNENFVSNVIEEHYSDASEEEKRKMKNNVLSIVENRFFIEI